MGKTTAQAKTAVKPVTQARPAPAGDLRPASARLSPPVTVLEPAGQLQDPHWLAALPPSGIEAVLGALLDALESGVYAPMIPGQGVPLTAGVRAEMEAGFGHDFSRVRVHAGPQAARSASALGAKAYTRGQDIIFGSGQYQPGTAEGRALLAHELAHTLHDQGKIPARAARLSREGDPLEREAETAARRIASGLPAGPLSVGAAAGHGWVHRQAQTGAAGQTVFERVIETTTNRVLDPEQILDALAWMLARSLQADPTDVSGRVRRQLNRMKPETRVDILARLERRMSQAQWRQLQGVLNQPPPTGTEISSAQNPAPPPAEATPGNALEPPVNEPQPSAGSGTQAEAVESGPRSAEQAQAQGKEQAAETPPTGAASPQAGGMVDQAAAPAGQAKEQAVNAPSTGAGKPEAGAKVGQAARAQTPESVADKEPGEDQAPAKPPVESEKIEKAAQEKGQAAPSAPEQAKPAQSAAAPPAAGEAAVPEAAPQAAGPETLPREMGQSEPASAPPEAEAQSQAQAPAGAEPAGAAAPAAPSAEEQAPTQAEPETDVPPEAAAAVDQGDEAATAESQATPASAAGPAQGAPAGSTPAAQAEVAPETPAMGEVPPAELLPPEQVESLGRTAPEDQGETAPNQTETGAPGAQAASAPPPGLPPIPSSPAPAETEAVQATLAEPEPEEPPAPPAEPTSSAPPQVGTAVPPAPVESAPASPGGGPVGPVEEAPLPAEEGPVPPGGTANAEAAPASPAQTTPGPEPAVAAPGSNAGPDGGMKPGCTPGAQDTQKPGEGGDGGEAGGGPCGGGGGGGAEQPEEKPAPPDVSQADPVQAMGSVSTLPPGQIPGALGGVSGAVSNSVGKQRDDMKANPPSMERPSGVPASRDPSLPVTPPELATANGPGSVARAEAGAPVPVPQPAPLPELPPSPVQSAAGPQLPGEAQLTEADAAKAQDAITSLPTTDPALNVTAGDPPQVELKGDADPQAVKDQQANLDKSAADTTTQGHQDASQPMGENNVYPTVPKETLKANPEGGEGPGVMGSLAACAEGGGQALAKAQGGAGGGGASPQDEAISIVAKEKSGDQIKGSISDAQAGMTTKQTENAGKISEEKTKSQKDIDQSIQDNAKEQSDERHKALEESLKQRGEWVKGQDGLVADANKQSGEAVKDARGAVSDEQTRGDKQAADQIQDGNKEAATARKDAEDQAREEKKKGKKESGGFFGWLSSKVSSFFASIKAAITKVFDAARKLVKAAIDKAKKLAVEVIEKARKAIVSAIQKAGDLLIKIGDSLLKDFPGLRDKFRKLIKAGVDAAVKTVNKLADKLKAGVQKLLDLLGKAINGLLGLLECGLLAYVDSVSKVVQGAINIAKGIVQALGEFWALIKDIAADPGGWISKLGAAVVSGIKNCLWAAFKKAVKQWFNDKLEEVLGLGLMIWNLLFKGCISLKMIGTMAWEGLKAAIPTILIQLLIEKLVAMIVPAAGAIMTIIEGLRAAWGTISRIISAIEKFFAFLKAVRGGNAAGLFAEAVAAAAIVVIDFVANWLLQRLRKPAGAIGGRLKAMAQKIGAALKKVGGAVLSGVKAVGRGMKAAGGAIVRGVKTAARAVASGARKVGAAIARGAKRVGQAIARSKVGQAVIRTAVKLGRAVAKSKIGQAIARGARALYQKGKALFDKAKAKIKDAKDRLKKWWEKRKEERERRAQEKLDRVAAVIRPKLHSLLGGGASRIYLWGMLQFWRVRYWLRSLSMSGGGDIVARVNPSTKVGKGKKVSDSELGRLLEPVLKQAEVEYVQQITADEAVRKQVETATQRLEKGQPLGAQPSDVQTLALRGAKPGTTSPIEVAPGVKMAPLTPGKLGRYEVKMGSLSSYPAMLASVSSKARALGVSDPALARILSSNNQTLAANMREVTKGMSRAKARAFRTALAPSLVRMNFLTQALEPARRSGVGAPTALAYTFAEYGDVPLSKVAGREGAMAPMTPVGAASEKRDPNVERLVQKRVGRIFIHLLEEAKHFDMYVDEEGYHLNQLADALRAWLQAKLRAKPDPDQLEKLEAKLRLELVAFMSSYHGRG